MKKLLFLVGYCLHFAESEAQSITFLNSNSTEYKNNVIIGSGNVVAVYDKKVISADRIEYDEANDSIKASDNIVIKDELGNTYYADYIEANNNFSSGYASNFKVLTSDKTRLAAAKCTIKNQKYELENVNFTPCYQCTKSGALTWQLKAKNVSFDPKSYTTYQHSVLESFDIPVLYVPTLTVVSANIKRKSGFLVPKFMTSSQRGASIVLPYLWSISDSQELIFKPILTTKIGHVAWMYYGLRIPHGKFQIDASYTGTKSIDKTLGTTGVEEKHLNKMLKSGYRGHVFSKFNYDIDQNWRTGFDINLVSDRYYLKRFDIVSDAERTLVSTANIEGFHNRNYTQIKSSMYQTDYLDSTPTVLPMIEHNHFMNLLGGTFKVDATGVNLEFKNGRRSQKYVINPSWSKDFVLIGGHLLNINLVASFQGLNVAEDNESSYDSYSQVLPQLNATWQWPIVFSSKYFAKMIVSPICGITLAPMKDHFDAMENPFDEITETNVFANNRSISPYNVDSGSRYFYGTKINGYNDSRNIYSLMIGQSVDITRPRATLKYFGNENKHSNILGSLDIFFTSNLSFSNVISYCNATKTIDRFESGITYVSNKYSFDAMAFKGKQCFYDPFKINDSAVTETIAEKKYKGMYLNANYKAIDNTSLSYSIVFGNNHDPIHGDFDNRSNKLKLLSHAVGATFENECSKLTLKLERNNRRTGDLKPETCFKFVVQLKKLN